jgi:hypothetical protein
MHSLNALLAKSQRIPQQFCLPLCLHSTQPISKVFINLEIFLIFRLQLVYPLGTLFPNSVELEVRLCTGYQNLQCFVTPSWHEASNISKFEIKQLLQMHIQNIYSQHIRTHEDIHTQHKNHMQ